MTDQLTPAELAWRTRCREDLIRHGRETGALQEFCTQPVDRFYLPHIPAEEAAEAVALLLRGYESGVPS